MRTAVRILMVVVLALGAAVSLRGAGAGNARQSLGAPDMERIATETCNPASSLYYPKLLRAFMANDTTMTPEQFQYLYYGAFFQEDYDPYRSSPNPQLLQELIPIYAKERRTRADRTKMADYANAVLASNPLDLRQLTNRIYVYEQNGKYDLAKIWQFKLNHLLLAIAASGTGLTPETAWIVVYPQHEYDFLNLSGRIASGQRFEAPHFDYISVQKRSNSDPEGYYFNIADLLEQYFIKHPGELEDDTAD